MTEKILSSIISNNLSAYLSGMKTREDVIKSIIECVYEKPKVSCDFGDDYCRIHKNGIKPCNKCRVSYEHELTNDD